MNNLIKALREKGTQINELANHLVATHTCSQRCQTNLTTDLRNLGHDLVLAVRELELQELRKSTYKYQQMAKLRAEYQANGEKLAEIRLETEARAQCH